MKGNLAPLSGIFLCGFEPMGGEPTRATKPLKGVVMFCLSMVLLITLFAAALFPCGVMVYEPYYPVAPVRYYPSQNPRPATSAQAGKPLPPAVPGASR